MSEEKGFQPTDHMMKLSGKDYLPVAPRTLWFRQDCPIDKGWGIKTFLIAGGWEEKYAVFKAIITDPEGREVGSGTAVEVEPVLNQQGKRIDGFPDYVEKAETSAIGRALATAGYGTMAALDEGEVVDAPIQRPRPSAPVIRQAKVDEPEPYYCSSCGDVVEDKVAQGSLRLAGHVLCKPCGRKWQENQGIAQVARVPTGTVVG